MILQIKCRFCALFFRKKCIETLCFYLLKSITRPPTLLKIQPISLFLFKDLLFLSLSKLFKHIESFENLDVFMKDTSYLQNMIDSLHFSFEFFSNIWVFGAYWMDISELCFWIVYCLARATTTWDILKKRVIVFRNSSERDCLELFKR